MCQTINDDYDDETYTKQKKCMIAARLEFETDTHFAFRRVLRTRNWKGEHLRLSNCGQMPNFNDE